MISSAVLRQTKGLGSSFQCSAHNSIASLSASTLENTPWRRRGLTERHLGASVADGSEAAALAEEGVGLFGHLREPFPTVRGIRGRRLQPEHARRRVLPGSLAR